jgi:hypothetical protein
LGINLNNLLKEIDNVDKKQKIIWEKTLVDQNGFLYQSKYSSKEAILYLRHLANHKMTSVNVISAEFAGEETGFEPSVCVLLEKKEKKDFFGVFEPVFAKDEDYDGPDLLVRKAYWDMRQDYAGFMNATNKKEYLESDKSVFIQNSFVRKKEYPDIAGLVRSIDDACCNGFSFKDVVNPAPDWIRVTISVLTDKLTVELTFNPYSINDFLNGWINSFIKTIEAFDFAKGVVPDNGFQISYVESLIEVLSEFKQI